MEASKRRDKIMERLKKASTPVVARELADSYDVSRQVIVGDIALLRASGEEILSTPKGYIMRPSVDSHYKKKIVCQHSKDQTEEELLTIVRLGGEVIDVIVEHPLYGEMSGALNIRSQDDVRTFLEQLDREEASLLSDLTDGLHTHTISAKNKDIIGKIEESLKTKGLLYEV
jgi:hypothetical protein